MNNKTLFAFIGIIIGILVATAVFGICYKSKNDINMGMPSGTSIIDDVSDYSNIDFNGYKLYVNGVAIN